ncbi:MAG: preprotein translocase subunit SecE [Deltaproteobacteria bacterium]|nr:preprotein translocase subunit SecE [Deltaproteobacteria bacterium]
MKSGGETPVRAVQKQAQKPAKQPPQKKPADTKTSGSGNVSNAFGKAGLFLREAKTELKKVKWPTRKELLASTAVVIVLTLFVALFLGLVDFGLIKIIKLLVN